MPTIEQTNSMHRPSTADRSRQQQRGVWGAAVFCTLLMMTATSVLSAAEPFQPVVLKQQITRVQPQTGIVLWDDSEHVETSAIQLEFSYVAYRDVVSRRGEYDWDFIDRKLAAIARRGHQAILRFYDTYPARPSGVPDYIQQLADYRGRTAASEGKPTGFPDWSHPEYQQFVLEFFTKFAERYDRDPRLAYLQVGFGLWSEYHIYDGPELLGQTFPDHAYQAKFLRHLHDAFPHTPWMISIDAADRNRTPFASQPELLQLSFGVFDDSFLCKPHARENEPNWNFFGRDRWQRAPAGGEFSYYNTNDQKKALAENGPNGVRFETAAAKFHLSFIIGSDQPNHAGIKRVEEAAKSLGYRLKLSGLETDGQTTRGTFTNTGIAPMYFDAYPALDATRSKTSLKGLLPGASRPFELPGDARRHALQVSADRLVAGQVIEFASP